MSGPLGGVGDLYAILGAGAYLGAQMIKSMGSLRDPICPIPELDKLVRDVFMEVAVDDDLERDVCDLFFSGTKTNEDIWKIVIEIRDSAKMANKLTKSKKNLPHEYMLTVGLSEHPYIKESDMDFQYRDIDYLMEAYPVFMPESPSSTSLHGIAKWRNDSKRDRDAETIRRNRIRVASYIMRVQHHRYLRMIAEYHVKKFGFLSIVNSIELITHHRRKEFSIREEVDKRLSTILDENERWLTACWKRIEEFKNENDLFYRLIHDHPTFSYRGDNLLLVRNGNDGFSDYEEYPTCWDYVGIAKPSLDNPVNREHFILMLCATYKITTKINWREVFDFMVNPASSTIVWQYYSDGGRLHNWIRGKDWKNQVKTLEEVEQERKELFENNKEILSDRFDL